MNPNHKPFYQDKNFYFTALGFTAFGYYALPKLINWYQNRNSNNY